MRAIERAALIVRTEEWWVGGWLCVCMYGWMDGWQKNTVPKMENKTMQSKSSSCIFLFLCLLCAIPIGNVVILFVSLSISVSVSLFLRIVLDSIPLHAHTVDDSFYFISVFFFVRVCLYVAHNLIHACSWQKYFTNVYSAIRTFTFVRIKIVMIWLFPVGFQSTRTFDAASHHFNQMEILFSPTNTNCTMFACKHIHSTQAFEHGWMNSKKIHQKMENQFPYTYMHTARTSVD